MKKKEFIIFPRMHSYGGIMDSLVKSIPIASHYNKKIKIIDFKINDKKNGSLFIRNISNIEAYKKLNYENIIITYSDADIYLQKIKLLIKTLILKYRLFSFITKIFFFLSCFNLQKAKEKFQNYYNSQNYYDAGINKKNFNYLQEKEIALGESDIQNIYLNRKGFQINDFEKNEKIIEKYIPSYSKNNSICFYIREKNYNIVNPDMKKNNNVSWYSKKKFKIALDELIKKNLKIIDLSNFNEELELNDNSYFNTNGIKKKSEIFDYCIAKNCKFFISTGGGKSELARIFKKPMLKVDHEYNIWHNFSFSTNFDHVIFGHVYSKKEHRFISIKEQFKNLEKIFPNIKNKMSLSFNFEDYILVKNSEEEILNLVKFHNFSEEFANEKKDQQSEIMDIKKNFIKKNCPDYFYFSSEFYPKNPNICGDFFSKTKDYSEYLETKTINFNKSLFQKRP